MILEVKRYDEIQHPAVWDGDDFSVFVEDCSIGWMLHCYVHQWKKSTYKRMLDTLVDILEAAPDRRLFAFANNNKLKKFCNMFGMVSVDDVFNRQGIKKGELLCLTQEL